MKILQPRSHHVLLLCGIAASVLYVVMNIVIPMLWPEYSLLSHTVSELSAINAPTRMIWVPLGVIYALLMVAFGVGVATAAGAKRSQKITGYLLVIYGAVSIYWPPMHQRVVLASDGETLTDTLHLIWAGVTVLLMVVTMCCGAAAFGTRFRWYSFLTILFLFVFGMVTSMGAGDVAANLPTPWIGIWERINIGLFLLWICTLALIVLRTRKR